MALTQFAFCAVGNDLDMAVYNAGAQVEAKAPTGTSAATTAAATATQNVCRVATDTQVYVSFGSSPNATSDTIKFLVPAGQVSFFRVASGNKAAVVTA